MIVGGILSPIENVLTEVLIWLHETGGLTWAWSIVALTVIVRMLLVPVAIRQIHSMQSLQIHAPEMKAIQQRYKADRQKQSEELMKFYKENKINPYASCLPIVFQIPIFIALFFVLRDFEDEVYGRFEQTTLEWLNLIDITEPTKDGFGPVLLVVYVISQLTSTWLMSTSMQSAAQRWMIMLLPIVFIPFILSFPTGLMIYWLTTNLWTTGQGLITRRQMPRPGASSQAVEPNRPEGGAQPAAEADAVSVADGAPAPAAGSDRAATPGEEEEGRRGSEAMTDATDVRIEASGETVGEAKWSALRELERLVPGLDREQVEFEILAEGERGLLGVGYSPARVIAKAPGGDAASAEASEPANDAREFVERIATAIGATVTVSASERDGVVTVTCSGEDLGLFIGKHGQTIDAIQYLANAVVRAEGERACGGRRRGRLPRTPHSVARSGCEPIRAAGGRPPAPRSSSTR